MTRKTKREIFDAGGIVGGIYREMCAKFGADFSENCVPQRLQRVANEMLEKAGDAPGAEEHKA